MGPRIVPAGLRANPEKSGRARVFPQTFDPADRQFVAAATDGPLGKTYRRGFAFPRPPPSTPDDMKRTALALALAIALGPLAAPAHAPYDRFIPAPGHGLGFNELKIIEAHELLRAIRGEPAQLIDFTAGLEIERAVHAMAKSHHERRWVDVRG